MLLIYLCYFIFNMDFNDELMVITIHVLQINQVCHALLYICFYIFVHSQIQQEFQGLNEIILGKLF